MDKISVLFEIKSLEGMIARDFFKNFLDEKDIPKNVPTPTQMRIIEYILNCKDIYSAGEYLKVRVRNIDIQNNIYELSSKDFIDNPFKNIRKYIMENGEYTGKIIGFPKQNSGVLVQLDNTNVTCLVKIPAKFNSYPHFLDNVLIKITEINENKKFIYGYLIRILKNGPFYN